MVKGFDTSTSDPSKAFLQYIFSIFQKDPPLSLPQASEHLKQYLSDPQTSTHQIYLKHKQLPTKPDIILKKRCPKPLINRLTNIIPYNGDKYYPAYIQQPADKDQNYKLIVCMEDIKNKIELKENVDRELYVGYRMVVGKLGSQGQLGETNDKEKDRMLMSSLYEGCYQGYRNYLLPEYQTEKLAKKCAIYLFRRRSQSDLPHDSLFRYADRMGQNL